MNNIQVNEYWGQALLFAFWASQPSPKRQKARPDPNITPRDAYAGTTPRHG